MLKRKKLITCKTSTLLPTATSSKPFVGKNVEGDARAWGDAAHDGYRRLQKACEQGDTKAVMMLVENGVDPRRSENPNIGRPALYWAVVRGKLEVVKLLVERYNCNPKFVTYNGTTLLHAACSRGHADVARYLARKHHLEPSAARKDGSTPLTAACYYGRTDVVKLLIEELCCDPTTASDEDGSLVHVACSNGRLELAQYLVSRHHLDPTQARAYGETPLHLASSNGHLQLVRYLVGELNCSLDCKDAGESTALHVAAQNGHREVVQYLLEKGCDVNAGDSMGRTALLLACIYGRCKVVQVLLTLGKTDPNCRNKDNESALQLTRNKTIFNELVRFGADTTNIVSAVFQYHKNHAPLDSLLRMFVVGHPSSGKSTLARALQQITGGVHIFNKRKVSGVAPRTAGIVPTEFESSEFGRVLLFDFAGQNEYYASHAALLEASQNSLARLFLLLVNLLEEEKEIKFHIIFWLSFINTHHIQGTSMAHIIVICSHKDLLKKESPSTYHSKISVIEGMAQSAIDEYSGTLRMAGFFATDCRKPHKHTKLRNCLCRSCKELRTDTEIDICCHVLSAFLCEKFKGEVACTISDVISHTLESDLPLPCKPEKICQLAEALSQQKNILFLPNSSDVSQSWIVLEVGTLLTTINGCIFAPVSFREHCIEGSCETGIVAWGDLQRMSRQLRLEPTLVVAFLKKLEFCEEVLDAEVLNLIQRGKMPLVHTRRPYLSDTPTSGDAVNYTHCKWTPTISHLEKSLDSQVDCSTNKASLLTPRDQHLFLSVQAPKRTLSSPNAVASDTFTPLRCQLSQSCDQLVKKDSQRYFFFPGLLHHEKPSTGEVWSSDDSFQFHSGWCIRVCQPNQLFMPRFLHILLLKVSFGIVVAPSQWTLSRRLTRECTVWKNGIRWLDLNGIETLVEMVEQNQAVIVLMRGKGGSEIKCVHLRSKLINLILQVKRKVCPNLPVNQYLLNPKELKNKSYPVVNKSLDSMTLYDIHTVLQCIVETKNWVFDCRGSTKSYCTLSDLLYFEPFSNLGETMLARLYQTEETDNPSNELYKFLFDFAQAHADRYTEMSEILRVHEKHDPLLAGEEAGAAGNQCMMVLEKWWNRSSSVSIMEFRERLTEYSVLGNRNLLVSI